MVGIVHGGSWSFMVVQLFCYFHCNRGRASCCDNCVKRWCQKYPVLVPCVHTVTGGYPGGGHTDGVEEVIGICTPKVVLGRQGVYQGVLWGPLETGEEHGAADAIPWYCRRCAL